MNVMHIVAEPGPASCEPVDVFAADVICGLSAEPKTLPCRYFYDARGSELFEDITRLPEYYPTLTELGILAAHVPDWARHVASGAALVEFGSGSSTKTELLLDAIDGLAGYLPIDISPSALALAAARLRDDYHALRVEPLVADFSAPIELPEDFAACEKIGFFPGSTIGNFAPSEAIALLRVFRSTLGTGARLIIGVDLRKNVSVLERAYDDAAGVTAAFNLNLLQRINRELGADFDLSRFRHLARYDADHGRIEMHLVSTCDQQVKIRGRRFPFAKGETIHTENSYKYTVPQFAELAGSAGWRPRTVWTDPKALFSVHELIAG